MRSWLASFAVCCSNRENESSESKTASQTKDPVEIDEVSQSNASKETKDTSGSRTKATTVGTQGKKHAPKVKKRLSLLVENTEVLALKQRLEAAGIDTSTYGQGKNKSLEELCFEVYKEQYTALVEEVGVMKRVVTVLQIKLVAQDMFGTWMHLVSTAKLNHDGKMREKRNRPSAKMKEGETLEAAVCNVFSERLGLTAEDQNEHLVMNTNTPKQWEKEEPSQGYPGLMALYRFYEVIVQVKDPTSTGLRCIGLPEGRDFVTMKGTLGESNFGTHLRMWAWEPDSSAIPSSGSTTKAPTDHVQKRHRVPVPERLKKGTCNVTAPNAELQALLADETADWERIEAAAQRIRCPDYSLREFHVDVITAFPELKLYLPEGDTTSGRSGDDEYQRTIGALFAFYWLMRLDIDGKEGFSFGVDTDWKPRSLPNIENGGVRESDVKRSKFFKNIEWTWFTELLVNSKLLIRDDASGRLSHCTDRTVAMLALTAIHDIMKVESLLPVVQKRDCGFHGFKEGERICDHDVALGYVLERFPEVLPSFAGLDPAQRRAVEFTQSKLEYNQGWLVQAEAPPAALFRTFKKLLRAGGVSSADVSFYFTHWLTDLAGAEPYPLEGSEKFVLQFPSAVLQHMLHSLTYVQELSNADETQVFEKYLCMRWKEQSPPIGPLPSPGGEGIALMRLLCQSQTNVHLVIDAFKALKPEDRELLGREMSLTGCRGQHYLGCEENGLSVGPALLMYYAPALLQKFGSEGTKALQRLCEVYKQARFLWPATADKVDEFVTVRIDTIKDKSHQQLSEILGNGEVFILAKHNDKEAFVEKHPISTLNSVCEDEASIGRFRFLELV